MIEPRQIKSIIRSHKIATTVILASLFILMAIVAGLFWSQRLWSDYGNNHTQRFESAKANINKAILQTSYEAKTRSVDKLNNITQVQSKLTKDAKSLCGVDVLIKWQGFINKYSDKIKDCNRQKVILNQLLSDLGELTGYLKLEQKLAVIILEANEKTIQNNQADKWNNIEAIWRKAATDVSKLPDTYQFKDVKMLAITKLVAVADAWKRLSTANDAKNRQQFEEARSILKQDYTLLVEISDNDKKISQKLMSNFNSSYEKVY